VHIAILTFEGYNELDSLIALGVLNRVKDDGWRVTIATPAATVTSMNGVVIEQMSTLEEACEADAEQYGQALGLHWFPVPAALPELDIRLFWHARLDADPAHRWLRDTIRDALGPAMSHVTH
jgi:DNA-binding transcriptional LysR family regulator